MNRKTIALFLAFLAVLLAAAVAVTLWRYSTKFEAPPGAATYYFHKKYAPVYERRMDITEANVLGYHYYDAAGRLVYVLHRA